MEAPELPGLPGQPTAPDKPKKKSRRGGGDSASQKRRCISTACIACRKRKSKCDGALPSCAACASVYGTECIYDPNSDHRRKGVYREKTDSMKARNATLQILIESILNASEDDVPDIVRKIRTCDSLDDVAESLMKQDHSNNDGEDDEDADDYSAPDYTTDIPVEGERDLARKMGELRLENGSMRFIGGTSHLIHLGPSAAQASDSETDGIVLSDLDPITSWSQVVEDPEAIVHLLNMYWTWHYPYFTTVSKTLFYRDFFKGRPARDSHQTQYCSSLLVNAMLALGCHFTDIDAAHATLGESRTKGDHFFAEAKRLFLENDEYEKTRLTTVQAIALMSVREAGCGREAKGWVYSGMSFRMAQDLGLNLNISTTERENMGDEEIDARKVTFWGCFIFDKCWSNYMGRLPQIPNRSHSVPKYDVFPVEDAEDWRPYTDAGYDQSLKQPSRTRAIGLQLSKLCEISSDLLLFFYHPSHLGRSHGKSVELKKLSELHRRLEDWRKELPREFEPKEGQLPNVILMHMFFHLQYIHLFRPFLKYAPNSSPLPTHVSPRRICTANAGAISKLMRLYKKLYNLRQICNIAVYMLHSACTIHLLNLPEKTARRDVIHGVKHLEEMAEDWIAGQRSLSIISVLARKWAVELPEEAAHALQRTDERWGHFDTSDVPSPRSSGNTPARPADQGPSSPTNAQGIDSIVNPTQPPSSTEFVANTAAILMPGMASQPADFSSSAQTAQQSLPPSAIMGNSVPLNVDRHSDWSKNSMAHAMPDFSQVQAQSFAPVHNEVSPPDRAPGLETSTMNPSSVYAVDGHDWYLRDGVNWASGFGTWNVGHARADDGSHVRGSNNVSDPSSVFMFTPASTTAATPATGSAPGTTKQSPASPKYDFDGLNTMSVDMDSWDLSGLD